MNLKDNLESFYSDVGTSQLSLLTCGYVNTNLDMAFRSRSKQASALWRDLYGSLPLTAPRIGIWVLLDAMFRYTGDMQCVQACLAACPQVELAHLFGQGLAEETQDRVTAMLQRGLKLDWTMRSTVSAYFSKGDGRKLVYPSPQTVLAPDDKRCDHMYSALASWARVARQVAEAIMSFKTFLEEPDFEHEDMETTALRCGMDLMHCILQFDLLGRPGVHLDRPVSQRAGCYAAKFPLDDIYWLLMCCTCTNIRRNCLGAVARARARCSCVPWRLLLKVRQQGMFIGPAFRNLLISLRGPVCTNRSSLEREAMHTGSQLLMDMNDMWGTCLVQPLWLLELVSSVLQPFYPPLPTSLFRTNSG